MNDPYELIPLITATASLFDSEHKDDEMMANKAITHADDLNAWLYGVKVGSIKETRYQINPDDLEINSFLQRTSRSMHQRSCRSVSLI
jgi:hypothetical protein